MSIQERLSVIQAHIEERPITLVAVTKYASLPQMIEAYESGVRHFGENKVQDALTKMDALPMEISTSVTWHFIGRLQSNKINKTVGGRFALIHSIDSLELAQELSLRNVKANSIQSILMQVNVTGEPSKQGFLPSESESALDEMKALPGLRIRGMMTMAPALQEEGLAQNAFCSLRDLRDRLASKIPGGLPELSMGMTTDYIQGIACGATIIRVGSALFPKQ